MKPSSPDETISQAKAKNVLLLNLFATPGLGSLLVKRWIAGTGQLVLFLAGFGLFTVWFVKMMKDYYGLISNAQEEPNTHGYLWMLEAGLLLAVAAWLWSLVTSLQVLRSVKAPPPKLETKPPILNP